MKEILDRYKDIIKKYEIIVWDSEPRAYRFKAIITLIDDSRLLIKDYILSHGRKYSFHWQDRNNHLIIRWDNAMHWKNIDTFPHHKHEKDSISSSKEVTLEDILNRIYEILNDGC